MSKLNEQLKHLHRSPRAMMDYRVRGRLPEAVAPSSPLITFLESKTPAQRIQMRNVRLSPELGYCTNMQFANAQLMLQFLKPRDWVVGSWPARSYQIVGFSRSITDREFSQAQKQGDQAL